MLTRAVQDLYYRNFRATRYLCESYARSVPDVQYTRSVLELQEICARATHFFESYVSSLRELLEVSARATGDLCESHGRSVWALHGISARAVWHAWELYEIWVRAIWNRCYGMQCMRSVRELRICTCNIYARSKREISMWKVFVRVERHDICARVACDLCESCTRNVWELHAICVRATRDMCGSYTRSVRELHEICARVTCDLCKSYTRPAQELRKCVPGCTCKT